MAYLTKAQVIADFVHNYLNKVSKEDRRATWTLMLDYMHKDKRITAKQCNSWKFPTKEVKEYDIKIDNQKNQ